MTTEREGRESMLARKLWELGKGDVFRGVTTDSPKERIRAAILDSAIQDDPAFRKADGDYMTFQEAFSATYGELLQRVTAA